MTKLIKISNYAKYMNFTAGWIYKLIQKGNINMKEVDGVKFVSLSRADWKKYKTWKLKNDIKEKYKKTQLNLF